MDRNSHSDTPLNPMMQGDETISVNKNPISDSSVQMPPAEEPTFAQQAAAAYYAAQRMTPPAGGFAPPPAQQIGYAPMPTPAPYAKKNKDKRSKTPRYASSASVTVAIILAATLPVVTLFGGLLIGKRQVQNAQTSPTSNVTITHIDSDYSIEENTVGTVANVTAKIKPTVVEIFTDVVSYSPIFGQQVTSGAGSGVIISEDGYIITCAHVIDGATKITVRLDSGESHVAELVGSDEETDVAVIRIEAEEKLAFAAFGNSDGLVVGQPVIAIGNPLGSLGGTVTTGIISATNREIKIGENIYNLLQTNAAINSGNSGGGLFDMNGNLIGVVNAKSSGSSIEGLGFAIPSIQAEDIAAQLIANGYVQGRPVIGVQLYQDADGSIYVAASEQEALKPGDRIEALDGMKISSLDEISSFLATKKPGDTITVMVSRKAGTRYKMETVSVTLREKNVQDQ